MKKGSYISFAQIFIYIILMVLNIFVFNITNTYAFFGCLVVGILILYFLLGYERNSYRNKTDILYTLFTNIIIFFIVTYIVGIVTGFYKNGYSLAITNIIKNSFPFLILILAREFYRYLYFSRTKDSKILLVLGIMFFVLLDINMNIHLYDINTTLGLTKMICLVIFPSIAKNIFLGYLTFQVGYENAIFYSLIMELKKFVLPIFPDFGMYIGTIVDVAFPLYLTISIYNKFKFLEKRKILTSRYHKKNLVFYSIVTFFLLVIIMLTSGYFKYYALTIGSASMTPNINKGDVVIVKKVKKEDLKKELKIKDVLVYNHDGKIIVHRLIDIKEMNNQTFYVTKGDNNLSKDGYLVKPNDVIGIIQMRIRYIGYPTVSLNEKISKEG